jgi:hypothetical protein
VLERRVVPPRAARAFGAVLLALAVVLPLLRQQGARSWNTIWGEDGWLYLQQAHDHGLSVVLRGYAGYLQLLPRLLVLPALHLALDQYARYDAIAAACVGAALAWFVYRATSGWIDSRWVRLALASQVVLLPALGYENTGNLTNTIWILFAVAPWALVASSERTPAVVARCIVAFLAATATALTAIFLPLALAVAFVRRRTRSWIVTGAFLGGLVLQFAVVSHTRDTRPHTTVRQLSALPQIVGIRVFGQMLVGDHGIRALWDHRGALAVVAPLLVLAILLAFLPGITRRQQALAATFAAFAIPSFVVPTWGRGTNQVELVLSAHSIFGPAAAGHFDPMASRYSVAPVMLLASAAAVVLGARRAARPRLAAGLQGAFVAWVLVVTVANFSVVNPRSWGPTWAQSVAAARHGCASETPATLARLPEPNPSVNPAVKLPCRELAPPTRHPRAGPSS